MTIISQKSVKRNTPNPWAEKVSVLAVHPNNHAGNIRAFVTIQIDNLLEIHSIKVVQQKGQRAYVRLPEAQSDGRFFPIIKALDARLMEAISTAALEAWQGGAE